MTEASAAPRTAESRLDCPQCQSQNVILSDIRLATILDTIPAIQRTRRCRSCDHKWATLEANAPQVRQAFKDADKFSDPATAQRLAEDRQLIRLLRRFLSRAPIGGDNAN